MLVTTEKWEAVCTAGGYETGAARLQQDGGLSKLRNRAAYDSGLRPTSESVTKEMKSLSWRGFFIHDNSQDIEIT